MKFDPPLKEATFLRRYKRFFADVATKSGERLTIHCPNTGKMTGCDITGSRIWYSTSTNKNRKLPETLELVEVNASAEEVVCVNTHRANQLVAEALANQVLPPFNDSNPFRREWTEPGVHGRFDFGNAESVVEVKSVTWNRNGIGHFPDATSARATKHIQGLMHCLTKGKRAVLLFCVPHTGVSAVDLAKDIDPDFACATVGAIEKGLEVYAYRWLLSPREFHLEKVLPLRF